jgi:hypothetical protein
MGLYKINALARSWRMRLIQLWAQERTTLLLDGLEL